MLTILAVLLPVLGLCCSVRPSIWAFAFSAHPRLAFPAYRITWPERILFFILLAIKAVLPQRLRPTSTGFSLPLVSLTCPVDISNADRKLYSRAAKLAARDRQTASDDGTTKTPFILAAMTNSMMVLLLAHPRCPVDPIGSVNVRNRFEFYEVTSEALDMEATATFGSTPGRRTKRGIEFDVVIDVKARGRDKLVLRQVLTVMKPLPKSTKPAPPVEEASEASASENSARQVETSAIEGISFPTYAPDVWAQLCGDYNPIHMSSLAAKLFGFPGRILHGNHVVAAFLDATASESSLASMANKKAGWALEVQFRRPMVLPLRNKRFEIERGSTGKRTQWSLKDDSKVYVTGSV